MPRNSRILRPIGTQLTRQQMSSELTERIRCARLWSQRHWRLLTDPTPRRKAKFQLYKSFIRPILTYGCEVWTLDNRAKQRLQRFESAILSEIYKSKYTPRHPKRLRPNSFVVLAKFKDKSIVDYLTNDRLTWEVLLRGEEKALKDPCRRPSRLRWWDHCQRQSKPGKPRK